MLLNVSLVVLAFAALLHLTISLSENSRQWMEYYYPEESTENGTPTITTTTSTTPSSTTTTTPTTTTTIPSTTTTTTTTTTPTPETALVPETAPTVYTPSLPFNSFCPQRDNCRFYQVNMNFTDYGCSSCQPSMMLLADERGVGECKAKNSIKNCKNSISRPDWIEGEPVCLECKNNFVLQNDSYTCDPVPDNKKIKFCNNYYQNNTEIYCNVCDEGRTLAEDRKTCESGCRMGGCESCQILDGKFFCFNCQPGYIGTFDSSSLLYKKCLTCDELQYNLRLRNSTYRPS